MCMGGRGKFSGPPCPGILSRTPATLFLFFPVPPPLLYTFQFPQIPSWRHSMGLKNWWSQVGTGWNLLDRIWYDCPNLSIWKHPCQVDSPWLSQKYGIYQSSKTIYLHVFPHRVHDKGALLEVYITWYTLPDTTKTKFRISQSILHDWILAKLGLFPSVLTCEIYRLSTPT